MFRHTLVVVLAALGVASLCAAEPEPGALRIPRVGRAPRLEDFVNGVPRAAEARIEGFRQREPGDGEPVSLETVAYLSYDEKNLYAVFVCNDAPANVRARVARREDIFGDDGVELFLDTFHDRRRSYVFAANPLGVQLDGIFTEGQDYEFNFDTLWRSEGRVTENGFVVLMAIPFKSLRFARAPEQSWGIALARIIPPRNEFSYWPHISKRVEGFVPQMATLEWSEPISPGRNMQFIPYASARQARLLEETGYRSRDDPRVGLDAKLVVRDALAADLTLNPDFSQVESDEPQVVVNKRFEVFFPEKRPFFLENANYFQTPVNLFFSRRIGDPQFGGRLTGKLGPWAVGGLALDDRAAGEALPALDPDSGRRAGIGVVRLQRDLPSGSTLGALVTSRDFGAGSSRDFSLDTRLKFGANWLLTGQAVASRSQRDGAKTRSGAAYYTELLRSGRDSYYRGKYTDIGADFGTELGFVPRVDIRQTFHEAQYLWRRDGGKVLSFGPTVSGTGTWDHRGRLQDWEGAAWLTVNATGVTTLNAGWLEAYELFGGREFRKHSTILTFNTEWLSWLTLSSSLRQGTGVNYIPGPGLPPFLGSTTDLQLGFTLRPTAQFRVDQSYFFSRLRSRGPEPASAFNNHLLRTRISYQFSRRLSARVIVDYQGLLPNSRLVGLDRAKRLGGDVLLSYLLNPGTALYLGYTDNYENVARGGAGLERIVAPRTSTGRQFFAKLSYLLRY